MPERRLKDSDRFNLMLAVTALLFDGEEYDIDELAEHFSVTKEDIYQAVKLVGFTELISIYDRSPFQVDYDDLNDGVISISFLDDETLTEVPRLSSRQASAIAAGLVYLSSLPGLAEVGEIEELQKIIASGIVRGDGELEIEVVPGSPNANLAVIRQAMTQGVAIKADYHSLRGETNVARVMEPLRLEPNAEYVYLRAWCPIAKATRAFRVDRMRNVQIDLANPISDEAKVAELPEDIYQPGENDVEVTIQVQPEAYSLIVDYKPIEEPIEIDKHTKQFTIRVGDLRNLGRIIARFGGAAKVIAPEQARVAVREFALQAISGQKATT
ncbi:MAG: hypothetical protein RIQ88_910, partial [Actinomycetota bacterium]